MSTCKCDSHKFSVFPYNIIYLGEIPIELLVEKLPILEVFESMGHQNWKLLVGQGETSIVNLIFCGDCGQIVTGDSDDIELLEKFMGTRIQLIEEFYPNEIRDFVDEKAWIN